MKLAEGSKSSSISGFKDSSISTSLPVIDLVDCIRPGLIDYEQVTAAENDEVSFWSMSSAETSDLLNSLCCLLVYTQQA